MTIKAYKKQGLIGGTSDDLDSIDGAALADDDFSVVMAGGIVYHYLLDESSGAAENSPNVITPDTNAGTKRWILQSSAPLTGDLDGQGNYAVDLQNFPDMIAGRGPGYWVDGVDDKISMANDADFNFSTGDFSALVMSKGNIEVSNRNVSVASNPGWEIVVLDGDILNYFNDIGGANRITNMLTSVYDVENQVAVGTVYNRSGNLETFVNGTPVGTLDITSKQLSISNTYDFIVGKNLSAITKGNIFSTILFNLALTPAEVKAFSNGAPIPYEYLGASQTALTSGTLIVDKQYIIDTFVAGDDFTNVGAASNASGVVFVATGTTPTTWTNSSSLRHEGCVLDLNESGIGHNTWQDVSGNSLHGVVSGALPINIPADHSEKYIDLTVTGDTSFTLPKDYIIDSVVLESSGAIGGGIDIGTTNGGGEIVTAQAVTGAGKVLCALVAGANYNLTGADDTIYITDADASGWDAAIVAFTVKMSRLEI